jgi:hypothetical protein
VELVEIKLFLLLYRLCRHPKRLLERAPGVIVCKPGYFSDLLEGVYFFFALLA